MNKINIGLLSLLFSAGAFAQTSPVEKYAKLITAEDAKKHLSIIASDAFEGRETGKPGATMAANYIAAEFKKLGLQPPVNGSYFLNVPLTEPSVEVKNFTINGTTYAFHTDFYTSSTGGAPGEKTYNVSEIVFIGHKAGGDLEKELDTTNITGKAVFLVNDGETPQNIGRRITFMQLKKPLLIIATSSNFAEAVKNPRNMGGGGRLSIKADAPMEAKLETNNVANRMVMAANYAPVFNISADVAGQLLVNSGETFDTFKASGDAAGMQPNQAIKATISATVITANKDVKAVDVLGYMPGTDLKDEVLVFSAHYDHIGLTSSGPDKVNNGADDDGSGTTGILEIAKAFAQAKKDGHGPRRSILFLGNVGEEKGLLGSQYYTDHPVFPLKNTITDLNIDMIGRVGTEYIGKPDSANYVYVIGSAMLSHELYTINDAANKKYTNLDLDYKYDDPKDPNRFYYRSDHYNFAKHGVPIIFYFNGVHADYHRPGDEVSKINFPMLAKRAQLVFYTGWELANRDKRPVVDVN